MPVRNALPYLDQAIESVLNQSHGDFEFIIGDDCSTDGSRDQLRRWAQRDDRIRLMESDVPLGPVRSSNWVARAATGLLVARMDADDLSRFDRLERQVQVLVEYPDAVLVGSLSDSIDRHGRMSRPIDRSRLLDGSNVPVLHSSIMYRQDAFLRAGGYREGCDFFEDADLYFRLCREGKMLVVPEPLTRVRFSERSGRLNGDRLQVEEAIARSFALCDQFRRLGYTSGWMEAETSGRVPSRLRLQTFRAIGSLRLWSGDRPAVFWRMLRRAHLRFDKETAVTLIWALWGSINASSLRMALRFRIRHRDRRAAARIRDGEVYQWWCSDGSAAPSPHRLLNAGADDR